MFYPKNTVPSLSDALFRSPSCEYRGAPFWAWNCKLDKDTLLWQIERFREMGFGGYHMHPRVGLATEYLSEEFMDLVKACVEKGRQEDMRSYLYDEDRWPSGAAGGIVTKNKRLRGKYLCISQEKKDSVSFEAMYEAEAPYLCARYDIVQNEKGELLEGRRLREGEAAAGTEWFAYLFVFQDESWYNNQAYIDTLNPDAMDEFIRVTYEAYEKAVGKDFGGRVPSIFTDEPQFRKVYTLQIPDGGEGCFPWTEKLPDVFRTATGRELLDALPEIVFELPDGAPSAARYHYYNCISDLFAENFAGRCGAWCDAHSLALTGHLMNEPTLLSQTIFVGDAMRSYRHFGIPGIDMLADNREFTTAKQCQSVVHQCGKEAMLSELYGVTSWDYDFKNHKSQGDWQAALGVSVRVPHLSLVSMKGEAKRDYPASISYQSPWFREYKFIEDHFARVQTAMTRGKPIVPLAVVHPIESFWLYMGPTSNVFEQREKLDRQFEDVTRWLLYDTADFDFLNEATLPQFFGGADGGLHVGEMTYKAVLVPACVTLRQTTLDILRDFAAKGGTVIFAGDVPALVDAVPSDAVRAFANEAQCVPFEKAAILNAVRPFKEVTLRNIKNLPADELLCSLRQDNGCRWLFLAHGERMPDDAALPAQEIRIRVRGASVPTLYDTIRGETRPIPYTIENGETVIRVHLERTDSVLLRLDEAANAPGLAAPPQEKKTETTLRLLQKASYRRAEPNVLLLDRAAYALDDEPLQAEDELLRVDTRCRAKLGWPGVGGHMAQPWVVPAAPPTHTLTLEFRFESETDCADVRLALEDAPLARITWNGEAIAPQCDGWFVDRDIPTLPLPGIRRGENVLRIRLPFGRRTSTEWCYLLGDFDVRVQGCVKTVVPVRGTVGFSDITSQGMPFYGGNLIYTVPLETPEGSLRIRLPHVGGALARVCLDGRDLGVVALAPFAVDAGEVEAGRHTLEITCFGNRYNTFGPLHSLQDNRAIGPGAWRTAGDDWTYGYNLRPTGLLSAPEIILGR